MQFEKEKAGGATPPPPTVSDPRRQNRNPEERAHREFVGLETVMFLHALGCSTADLIVFTGRGEGGRR